MERSAIRLLTIGFISFVLIPFFISTLPASADIGPPPLPPGANPGPEGITNVRMLAEVVTISLLAQDKPQAKVVAVFSMLNTGGAEEQMRVRFPLCPISGCYQKIDELNDFSVKVDGRHVNPTRVEMESIPWATFPVVFPIGEPTIIEIGYVLDGQFGYRGWFIFDYILETGAGWYGTIGSADIIVQLPYEIEYNENLIGYFDYDHQSEVEPIISVNEARWHLEDFEPDGDYNFTTNVIPFVLWKNFVDATEDIARNPEDGKAWGRLAKFYKARAQCEIYFLCTDPEGIAMVQKSREAYQKALTALPNDAGLHAGLAELFWQIYLVDRSDTSDLMLALQELDISLRLDPRKESALGDWMASWEWEYVQKTDSGYVLIGLTATPTPEPLIPTKTSRTVPTFSLATPTSVETTPFLSLTPSASPPKNTTVFRGDSTICMGLAFLSLISVIIWLSGRKNV